MNRKNGILLVFLLVLMATVVVPIYAISDDYNMNVHAKAVNADSGSVKNDIAVKGNIIIATEEDTINVNLQIVLIGPDEKHETQKLSLEYEASEHGNTLLTYNATFYDFASVKGMYYVTVTSIGDLTGSADFKWDPPGGGGGPPEY